MHLEAQHRSHFQGHVTSHGGHENGDEIGGGESSAARHPLQRDGPRAAAWGRGRAWGGAVRGAGLCGGGAVRGAGLCVGAGLCKEPEDLR